MYKFAKYGNHYSNKCYILNQLIVSDTGQSRSPRLQTGEYYFYLDLLYVGIFSVELQR